MHAVTHSHTCTHMWARIYRNMYTRCVLSMYTPTLFFVRLNGVRRGASGGCRRAFRFGGSRQRGYGCTHICDKMHADKHTHLCAHMFALVYPNMYICMLINTCRAAPPCPYMRHRPLERPDDKDITTHGCLAQWYRRYPHIRG